MLLSYELPQKDDPSCITGRGAELERSLCSTSNGKHSFVGKTVNKEHMAQIIL